MKRFFSLVLVIVVLAVLVPVAGAAPRAQGEEYTVRAGDWLSKLADKYLGDPMAYMAIVRATNIKHFTDPTYAYILIPDIIEPGQKVWIPSAEEAATLMSPPKGTTLKIGFNSSATGTYASLGLPEAKTAEMIQEQINAAGGVVGPDGVQHDVKIIIYDDENEADKAVSNVTRLIQEDEVIVVVSTTGSGTSIAHIPVCEENETACISMASAKPITTNPETGQEYKWMFKTPQTNGHAGEWQAAYLKAKGVSKVCILYTDDAYGADCLAEFKAQAEAAGLEVVYEAGYAKTDTEFSAQVAGAQASGCQAVEIGSTPAVASLATIAVRTAMPDTILTLGHGVCNKAHIDTAGAAAEGTVFPCGKVTVIDRLPEGDPQKAVLLKYINDYTAFTGGEPISTFGGHGWDGAMMAVQALSSLKEGMTLAEQRAAVRDYLENNIKDWPGISGVFTFSPTDHNGLTKDSLLFVKVVNGEWTAFPEPEW